MKELVERILGWRPVRVVTHFNNVGGSILAGGMSYQAIFAIFAAVWVGFSIAGLFLTANQGLLNALYAIINQSIPGLIGSDGIIDPDLLATAGIFTWTGAIALAGLLLTALGWLSTTAQAVRTVFGMPPQTTFFIWVKLRELGLGLVFGLALVVSALVSLASTALLGALFGLFQIPQDSFFYEASARGIGLAVVLIIDTLTLAGLFRVLSRVRIPVRRLFAGALLGGVALGVLKILGGALLGGASRNPLLATFAVIIGLLIWFNLVSTVTLIAAAWIAVGMNDAGIPPQSLSADEAAENQEKRMQDALRLTAQAELTAARADRDAAPWYARWAARRRLRAAEARVAEYAAADDAHAP
ncbi:YihY/virulence factor BrkB family protein [Cryobacterium sp. TMT1-3]|uniref:YihY/virulence factor BrkB family protein n=1 Tax=Cryobacterium luteum TaxID=1424661 RepID=A0A5F0DAS4_9MICO|nr:MULTISPECIES: YihY/virulence factor BrkB family protein [Cryobacterium]TFB93272.1 YihY/virulence factor BrkB family protein [Cryobacterium luteum]TFC28713.1 YihY/virulence factor BrkB family protein [Cryobacterium sp. TMT1-3]